jgi:hypothetical protein
MRVEVRERSFLEITVLHQAVRILPFPALQRTGVVLLLCGNQVLKQSHLRHKERRLVHTPAFRKEGKIEREVNGALTRQHTAP